MEEGKSLITNTEKENIDYSFKGKNAFSSLSPWKVISLIFMKCKLTKIYSIFKIGKLIDIKV